MYTFGFAYITEKLKWTPIALEFDWAKLIALIRDMVVERWIDCETIHPTQKFT